MANGVLDGVRVVDFGQYIAGPLAALMLADQGADVIHVDPPGGPRRKTDADAFYNRGKRRIVIDLEQPADCRIARELIGSTEVVIENFRPGVMDRFGLGPREMTGWQSRLIYCSLPGFASDDPRAHVAAWEGVVAAATDTYALAGDLFEPSDLCMVSLEPDHPVYTALPLASNFAAFHAATAIVMALIARERGAGGQTIEVPLFDAMFELIGANGIALNGLVPVGRSRGGGTFVCADGRRIVFNSFSSPRFLRWFAEAADVADWADAGLLDAARLEAEPELRRAFRAAACAVRRALRQRVGEENQCGRRSIVDGALRDGVAGKRSCAPARKSCSGPGPGARTDMDGWSSGTPLGESWSHPRTATSARRRPPGDSPGDEVPGAGGVAGCADCRAARGPGRLSRTGSYPGGRRPMYGPNPGGIWRRRHQDQPCLAGVPDHGRVAVHATNGPGQPAARAPQSRQENGAA